MPPKKPRPKTPKKKPKPKTVAEDKLLSIEEAAELLITSTDGVRVLIRTGELPVVRKGQRPYLREKDVQEFIWSDLS